MDIAATDAPPDEWALVEIFGHRQHYGKISEVARFGAQMLRIDCYAPDDMDAYATHYYGGSAIFSMTRCTEELARKNGRWDKPKPAVMALPPSVPYGDDMPEDVIEDANADLADGTIPARAAADAAPEDVLTSPCDVCGKRTREVCDRAGDCGNFPF